MTIYLANGGSFWARPAPWRDILTLSAWYLMDSDNPCLADVQMLEWFGKYASHNNVPQANSNTRVVSLACQSPCPLSLSTSSPGKPQSSSVFPHQKTLWTRLPWWTPTSLPPSLWRVPPLPDLFSLSLSFLSFKGTFSPARKAPSLRREAGMLLKDDPGSYRVEAAPAVAKSPLVIPRTIYYTL